MINSKYNHFLQLSQTDISKESSGYNSPLKNKYESRYKSSAENLQKSIPITEEAINLEVPKMKSQRKNPRKSSLGAISELKTGISNKMAIVSKLQNFQPDLEIDISILSKLNLDTTKVQSTMRATYFIGSPEKGKKLLNTSDLGYYNTNKGYEGILGKPKFRLYPHYSDLKQALKIYDIQFKEKKRNILPDIEIDTPKINFESTTRILDGKLPEKKQILHMH